jgi:hypothetical protein
VDFNIYTTSTNYENGAVIILTPLAMIKSTEGGKPLGEWVNPDTSRTDGSYNLPCHSVDFSQGKGNIHALSVPHWNIALQGRETLGRLYDFVRKPGARVQCSLPPSPLAPNPLSLSLSVGVQARVRVWCASSLSTMCKPGSGSGALPLALALYQPIRTMTLSPLQEVMEDFLAETVPGWVPGPPHYAAVQERDEHPVWVEDTFWDADKEAYHHDGGSDADGQYLTLLLALLTSAVVWIRGLLAAAAAHDHISPLHGCWWLPTPCECC